MTLAELSLKRPVTVIMVFVSMTVIGLIAAFRLPLELVPDFQDPEITLNMPYPGSTPAEIERTITRPVEDALATLTGIQHITSTSSAESAQIAISFKFGQDTSVKTIEALGKIDAIREQLPSDLPRYYIQKFSTGAIPVVVFVISAERDLTGAYELLNSKLKRPIERLNGVAKVELWGASPREVQIEVSSDRLTAAGVNLAELYRKLSAANFSASGGLIQSGSMRYHVQPVGEWASVEEIRNLVIANNGTRLGDIAQVSLQPTRADYVQHLDQKPAVILAINKERAANVVDVGRGIFAEIDGIRQTPEMQDVKMAVLWNGAKAVTDSLQQLGKAGLEGTLLSILVLFFFLRDWPSTLMVSLSIPICFIITLGCMNLFGMSLNLLSMMGLLLAVGMLVDNAVVVVESIYQYRERYPARPWYAAVQGTQIVGIAIAAGTLSSVIVFVPLVFGDPDQLKVQLFQIAITMGIAHLSSWLVAVSLVPMLSAKLPPPKFIGKTGFITRLQSRYGRLVALTLRHRRWTMTALLALMVLTIVPFQHTRVDLGGDGDPTTLHLFYRFNGTYSLEETKQSVDRVEAYLIAHRTEFHIRNVFTYFDERGQSNTDIYLETGGEKFDTKKVMEQMREGMPKLAIGEVLFNGDNGRDDEGKSINLKLGGDSIVVLQELADQIMPMLRKQPSLRDVRTSSANSNEEMAVHVDREKAKAYGFSASDVAQFLSIALRGQQLKDFHGGEAQVPVWLRFGKSDTHSLDSLSDFKVRSPDGKQVPLLAMVDIQTTRSASSIGRTDRRTALRITANLADEKTNADARKEIEAVMQDISLPAGYRWNFGHGFDREEEQTNQMLRNILIALMLVYVVMCAMFESLIYPAAILTTFVFSIFGIFWFFWITGTTFTFMSFIGVLILMGVVVNNGIVMIVHINQLRHANFDRAAALIQGAKDRLRPILMTMGTAILGMVPLCFEGASLGGDGPQYFPMARAIVGGLLFSTLVSLLVLPTIYSLLDDMSLWSKRVVRDARRRTLPRLRASNEV